MAKKLRIVFLGGVEEIGKNMMAIEFDKTILVIDAGLSFPNSEEMPGVDFVIPDFHYLVENKKKIGGILITHGHEDHIGALPFILKDLKGIPVYGSNLSLALAKHKLDEANIKDADLHVVNDREVIEIGCFKVEFVRVTHSIAGAYALAITTPKGVIFCTGDFKIDHTPIDNKPIDLRRIAEIGEQGVLLLMMDSTNVERSGYSMSERNVAKNFDNLFHQNRDRRIIVATFASNIHRVQQIINCAVQYGRKVAFSGRSMKNIAEIGHSLGELKYPKDIIVENEKDIIKMPDNRICIIATGTQGEPMSALTRMSQTDFKKITLGKNDTVLLSASPIPGNEKMIYNVINNLYKKGVNVVYQALSEIHVSGHACKEELKTMFSLIKPKFFIPVHGEYRHLFQHVELAREMGVNDTLIPSNGDVIEIDKGGPKRVTRIAADSLLLDGIVTDNAEMIIRDRKHLSVDGFVVAIVTIINESVTAEPVIITRGFSISDAVNTEIKEMICQETSRGANVEMDIGAFKKLIRKQIARIISDRAKKNPMIIPIVIEN